MTSCASGLTECGGACRDLQTDRNHCNACNRACAPGEICAGGMCTISCASGLTACSGVCRDTLTDRAHCGACGRACGAGQICTNGVCTLSCGSGLTACGSACVNLQNDPANCSACGRPCSSGQVCVNGACAGVCGAGQLTCGGVCVTPATDVNHCGRCSNACPAGAQATAACVGGACQLVCSTGFGNCDSNASNGCETDLRSSNANCGACGNVCAGTCVNGACQTCNVNVLVLGSDQSTMDRQFADALRVAGLNPTLIADGVINYTGTPAATNFGVIVPIIGNRFDNDMPLAGQTAIAAAQAAGRGVVLSEWAAYHRLNNRWANLASLLLFTRSSGTAAALQYTNTVSHPIWQGLPGTFATLGTNGGNISGVLVNGGTQIATSPQTTIGVAVRTSPAGRVAQISMAANWTNGGSTAVWTGDANTTRLFTNAVLWAAGCR